MPILKIVFSPNQNFDSSVIILFKRKLQKKVFIKNDDLEKKTQKSSFFSLVGAIMGTPADVVKARMMNQPTDAQGRGLLYKSSWQCLSATIKNEGFFGLYKGFVPCWLRMAPWSLTFWLSYEQIRKFFGAPSWGA